MVILALSKSRDHWALNDAQSLLSNIFFGGSIGSQIFGMMFPTDRTHDFTYGVCRPGGPLLPPGWLVVSNRLQTFWRFLLFRRFAVAVVKRNWLESALMRGWRGSLF
jgi:hypothetical protein